jgi:hypothetical protein
MQSYPIRASSSFRFVTGHEAERWIRSFGRSREQTVCWIHAQSYTPTPTAFSINKFPFRMRARENTHVSQTHAGRSLESVTMKSFDSGNILTLRVTQN